ncbi:MAG: hypothetical protein WC867_07105 [Candidatus Pacearchaeota archaeon]
MKKKKISKKLIIITIVLLVILTSLILSEFGFYDKIKNINKEPSLIELKDECSLIMNTILHQIENEDKCKIRCYNECNIRKMKFFRVEFSFQENSCHKCDCYCK